jgi:hypothetical protein
MDMEIGTEAAQFQEKEYINGVFVALQRNTKAVDGAVIKEYKRSKNKSAQFILIFDFLKKARKGIFQKVQSGWYFIFSTNCKNSSFRRTTFFIYKSFCTFLKSA